MEISTCAEGVCLTYSRKEIAQRAAELSKALNDALDQGVTAMNAEIVALIALQLKDMLEAIAMTGGDITHITQDSPLERAFRQLGDYRKNKVVRGALQAIDPTPPPTSLLK